MANFKKMMQQAANMQRDMERVQTELAEKTVEFSAGGGMVSAVASGAGTLNSVTINPEAVDPAEVEILQDMVLAACNGAVVAAKTMAEEEMSKVTSGLNLPGMM